MRRRRRPLPLPKVTVAGTEPGCALFERYNSVDLLCDQPLCLGNKLAQWHRSLVALAACAHAYCPGTLFLVAKDKDVRDLLVREIANLCIHLLVADVCLHPEASGLQLRFHLLRVGNDAAR